MALNFSIPNWNTGNVNPFSGQLRPPESPVMTLPSFPTMKTGYSPIVGTPFSQVVGNWWRNPMVDYGTEFNQNIAYGNEQPGTWYAGPVKAALNLLPMAALGGASVGVTPQMANAFALQNRAAATAANLAGTDTNAYGIVPRDYISEGIQAVGNILKRVKIPVSQSMPQPVVPNVQPVVNAVKTIGKEIAGIEPKRQPIARFTGDLKKAADELTAYINDAPRIYGGEQAYIQSIERSKRAGAIQAMRESALDPLSKAKAMSGARKGGLPKVLYEPPANVMSDDTLKVLLNEIQANPKIRPYDSANATDALQKVWHGELLQPHEIELLTKIFGDKLMRAVSKKSQTVADAVKENIMSIAGIPRATMATFDQSAWFRQGILYTAGHPLKALQSMWKSVKSSAYSKWAFEVDDVIRNHPDFPLFQQIGGYMAPLRKEFSTLGQLEETYASKAVQHIPGVRQSERAYVNYLNMARFDIFKNMLKNIRDMGIDPKTVNLGSLADFANISTGRGMIGQSWKKGSDVAVALNNVFFSPRLMVSRFQLPILWAKLAASSMKVLPKGPRARLLAQRSVERVAFREATRQIASFVGFGISVLILGSLLTKGKVDVELDPRSSDFAKLKIGNTRIDPWGGFQQYVKFFAQLLTGSRKVVSTGGIREFSGEERATLPFDFLLSKANPVVGLTFDILRGRTMVGEEIEATPEGASQQTWNRLAPLAIQDMVDGFKDAGLIGIAKTSPGIIGMGITTYPDVLSQKQANIGKMDDSGEPYTLGKFGTDVKRYGYSAGANASPLVRFYFDSMENIEAYYKTPSDDRFAYRKANPRVDAALFFWGRVSNVQTLKAKALVQEWLNQYNMTDDALHTEISSYERAPQAGAQQKAAPRETGYGVIHTPQSLYFKK